MFISMGGTVGDPMSNLVIDSCVASFNGNNGVYLGEYVRDALIKNNTFNNNGQNSADAYNGGLYIANAGPYTSYGIIVEYNIAHSNGRDEGDAVVGSSGGGIGIWYDTLGSNSGADPVIFRYNLTYNNANTSNFAVGVFLENCEDAQMYGNVSYGDDVGLRVATSNATYHSDDNVVYNNTVYNATTFGIQIGDSDTENTIVKNNIVHTAGTHFIYHESATNTTFDYNLYYDSSLTNKWDWNDGHSSTLGDWQTASSQDANSPAVADPLFTNAGSNDFTLQASSPAIRAGVDLGASYDLALTVDSSWPSSVRTMPQGEKWEIGAYIYQALIDTMDGTTVTSSVDRDGSTVDHVGIDGQVISVD
jgi:parallel beta-helix repeat protein